MSYCGGQSGSLQGDPEPDAGHYPKSEPTDMRPPGYAARLGSGNVQRCLTIQQLLEDPNEKKNKGRDAKRENEKQNPHSRSGKKQQICAHHRRNRTAGAHCGNDARGVEVDVRGVGQQSPKEIKDQKFEAAAQRFDVVGEDP